MDTTQLPKTRAEAKAVGTAYYFTGAPCKHGHVAPRKTKGACIGCLKNEWATGVLCRAEYFKQYNRSDAGKSAKRRYYEANREIVIARAKARPIEEQQQYRKAWKQANLIQVLADNKVRRRKHRQAMPPWVTKQQKIEMRKLYQMAITMAQTTGERYVVDHIIPLRSELVCGLHVPWNLRVITRAENLTKSNKLLDSCVG
jgi:hypothetical protein